MDISKTLKSIIDEKGCTQKWVVDRMNLIAPHIRMSSCKFSAILHGKRKMSGDELISFCKATTANPDIFFDNTAH